MLTPTGVTYADYWDAIKAGNPTHVRFTFLGQNIVLEDEDVLLSSGVNLTDMFNGDTDLVFGRTLSKQITVTFINSNRLNGLQWTGEFTLEFGVEINGTTNWVTMGYFSGEKPNNVTSAQTIQFTAYDRMRLFNGLADEFVKSISYPKTVKQIYDALCSYVGLQNVSGDELASIMSRSFASAPAEMEGYTCRDLLAMIAESCGCYAKITSEGKVKLVWFTDNTAHAVTGTEEFSVESGDVNDGMTWDEADTFTWDEFDNFTWNDVCGYQEALRIDRLYVKQLSSDMDINYPYDYGDMVYSIVDNPFLSVASYADVTSYLKPIYDRLYNFGGYLPVSLECVGNWCVEAGDIITIDVNTLTITFPVFVKTMRWSGAINDAYETTGTTNRQVYSSEANKQRVLTSKEIKMYVDDNYYKIRSGITIAPEGVTVTGGKFIKIESGGVFDVQSSNFSISSATKEMVCGGNAFNETGFLNTDSNGRKVFFGSSSLIDSTWKGGFTAFAANDGSGTAVMFASPIDNNSITALTVACQKKNTYYWSYVYAQTINLYSRRVLGTASFPFTDAYISSIYGQKEEYIVGGVSYQGYYLSLNMNIGDDTPSNYGNASITFSCTADARDTIRMNCGYVQNGSGHWAKLKFQGTLIMDTGFDAYFNDVYVNREYYNYAPTSRSSREIKHGIEDMESVGDRLDALKPVTYIFDDDLEEKRRPGLIYEDTVEVMPEICTDDESNKGISYTELIPMLLKEIQDLRARVKTLEEREV